jgi:hypothetical protein
MDLENRIKYLESLLDYNDNDTGIGTTTGIGIGTTTVTTGTTTVTTGTTTGTSNGSSVDYYDLVSRIKNCNDSLDFIKSKNSQISSFLSNYNEIPSIVQQDEINEIVTCSLKELQDLIDQLELINDLKSVLDLPFNLKKFKIRFPSEDIEKCFVDFSDLLLDCNDFYDKISEIFIGFHLALN